MRTVAILEDVADLVSMLLHLHESGDQMEVWCGDDAWRLFSKGDDAFPPFLAFNASDIFGIPKMVLLRHARDLVIA